MKHLLDIASLPTDELREILEHTGRLKGGLQRSHAQRRIVNCFFENSTRTRVSFEIAAQRLGASVVNFSAEASSLSKGESLVDTLITIDAMAPDCLIIRHPSSGAAQLAANYSTCSVINAGDGCHEHPTQALGDSFTLATAIGTNDFDLSGRAVLIVGDFDHSRVARSIAHAFGKLGADVAVAGPVTLTGTARAMGLQTHSSLGAIAKFDVVYTIRPQSERMDQGLLPTMGDYVRQFSITDARFASMKPNAVVMEAGPLVRGVQLSNRVAADRRCLKDQQVANGVFARMAVMDTVWGADQ